MRLLLDTHILLWWLQDSRELVREARALIEAPDHLVYVSAASVWEVAIKAAIGKIRIDLAAFDAAVGASMFTPLSIAARHAIAAAQLPPLHRDPFDRMLVAQSQAEGLQIVTHDPVIARYGPALVM